MDHDSPDFPSFHVALKHEAVDAGGVAVVQGRLATSILTDPSPVEVMIADAEGNELACARFIDDDDGWHRTGLVRLQMPAEPGEFRFVARLQDVAPAEDDEDFERETYARHEFSVATLTHSTQVVVWGVPSAVEAGASFRFRVGLRCSCGCSSAGWPFVVMDGDGNELVSASVGDAVLEGTSGLCHAEVVLTAPAAAGLSVLTVHAPGSAEPIMHAARDEVVRLRTVEPALHEIRVTACDAETGQPVPRAKVVAHPYRTLADADGQAVLRVAPGTYTLFASGKKYFAFKQVVEVAGDVDIRADLHHDRELSHEDMWS